MLIFCTGFTVYVNIQRQDLTVTTASDGIGYIIRTRAILPKPIEYDILTDIVLRDKEMMKKNNILSKNKYHEANSS